MLGNETIVIAHENDTASVIMLGNETIVIAHENDTASVIMFCTIMHLCSSVATTCSILLELLVNTQR